ncbi:hypothetical protein CWRG_02236 [Chthonomonas calidirosea]|uniref:glycosyl hydrolase n=1 Tax=Chthonomonas calidirosea TaxID=454171 RepID=UPI0006DD54FE|nr:glycosyl hydrolase [Chthonomonas calidirosea]CEK18637.1 hypothetical protein CWRG_02236 [Chthonomonas calidirosea]
MFYANVWKPIIPLVMASCALAVSAQQSPAPGNSPIVDRFGQYLPTDWPGKVHTDADLQAALTKEQGLMRSQWLVPQHRDPFGGETDLGWHAKATGFYYVLQHNGKWWLVTPQGNPCFYTGVCTVPTLVNGTPITGREDLFVWLPPKTGTYAPAWGRSPWDRSDTTEYFSFDTANLIRKFGADWAQQARSEAIERLQHWGFCGAGKWSEMLPNVPSLPVLWYSADYIGRHPDIFDPKVQAQIRQSLQQQIAPRRDDPYILGWSIKNEFDEIITTQEIKDLLQKPAAVPAKRALVDEALKTRYHNDVAAMAVAWHVTSPTREALYNAQPNPPADDLEALRQFFAKSYYAFLYKTVKQIDPHHLYFGFWIVPGWWQNASDWQLIAPYCDVIGYDRYANTFADQWLEGLFASTKKPVLCGEFSFPPYYQGQRGFGRYSISTTDENQEADLYTKWARDAAYNPYCVGFMWFEYRDEPITGRGPGHGTEKVYGENYAFGLVDVADRPRWDLVSRMREVNLQLDRLRSAGPTTLAK